MRKKLVVGNWKMQGNRASNQVLLEAVVAGIGALRGVDCAVCVPFPYLGEVAERLVRTPLAWGAQNLSEHAQGAYTGEVSAAMLAEFGCRYVIVGAFGAAPDLRRDRTPRWRRNSRRRGRGASRRSCAWARRWRSADAGRTEQVVERQLEAVLESNGRESFADAVLAYEPVWAIGTGRTASPEQAQAVHAFPARARVLPDTPHPVRRQREAGQRARRCSPCRTWTAG